VRQQQLCACAYVHAVVCVHVRRVFNRALRLDSGDATASDQPMKLLPRILLYANCTVYATCER
jgi:hypothetical protein